MTNSHHPLRPVETRSMTTADAHNVAMTFQQVVAASATRTALICEGSSYDFATLNGLANRFARWLSARGVTRGDVVCLELPKMVESYALALACLKMGAPYAFLDPTAPAERAKLAIDRCAPAMIVSLRDGTGHRVVIDGAAQRDRLRQQVACFDGDDQTSTARITGADPAYVMFTSGSTGEPKGVVIPHQGVLQLVGWAARDLEIGPGDRLTNVNPIFFDNSVFDIYAALLNGAAVVALDMVKGRPPSDLVAEISAQACTFFFATPTLFMHLDSMKLLTPERLSSVRCFMFGGEGFPLVRLRRFFDSFAGQADLINCYGPTETSCICSSIEITASTFDTSEPLAPLGRLNPNFSCRILNDDLRPVAAGDVGELWLGGPCVGLGYLNSPEETAKRFRQDPLIHSHRATLYRTGDLVAADDSTGLLHFHGRADNQVKLRGYRVELEEIDHVMAAVPGVTRALAIVLSGSGEVSRLVAAYSGDRIDDAELTAQCRQRLPSYMVPGRFTWLETIPTNANGKADRRTLAELLEQADLPKAL